jgi:predicted Zn-dependent peptidase
MRGYYNTDRIIISAAGNIEHKDVVKAFEEKFKRLEPVKRESKKISHSPASSIVCSYKELEQIKYNYRGKGPHPYKQDALCRRHTEYHTRR